MEIKLYNRNDKKIVAEIVFEKKFMNFFYATAVGLFLSSLLIKRKWFSILYGKLQKTKRSRKRITKFIEQYKINLDEIELPIESYLTFNDFFTRKLKTGIRSIDFNITNLISPADARLIVLPILDDLSIPVKGKIVNVAQLLSDTIDFEVFKGGICAVFRLAPTDYHRFCYIDDAYQSSIIFIKGYFHSVSPFALKNNIKVFDGNYRELCVLKTINFDNVIQVDVGALTVGRIIQHFPQGGNVKRGDEKGFFEFGASTIILLFKPDVVIFDNDILNHSKQNIETIVKMGEKIGTKRNI